MNEITIDFLCRRDGIATKQRCASCDVSVCVRCLVRTPVGPKCATCAGVGIAAGSRSAGKSGPGATAPVAVPSISVTRWAALFDALISPVRSGAPR